LYTECIRTSPASQWHFAESQYRQFRDHRFGLRVLNMRDSNVLSVVLSRILGGRGVIMNQNRDVTMLFRETTLPVAKSV
jgi:hypothetical protein